MKSGKTAKTTQPAKNASLESAIDKNEKIKETVQQAADDLTSVNDILKQGKDTKLPAQIIKEAIAQNREVEYKVAKAADDLHQVNTELVKEVAERLVIETELSDMKSDLAEVRDDLLKSQISEEESRNSALHDALTGLPNRLLLEERLEHGLVQAKRHERKIAVLFMDLDDFKNINDSHGHDAGDRVLLTVAERLLLAVREEDTVCRWGGDEFVCLLSEIDNSVDVLQLAETLVNNISEPFMIEGMALSIKVSIGIALYPENGETAEILLKNADTAMYKAKGTAQRVVLFGA